MKNIVITPELKNQIAGMRIVLRAALLMFICGLGVLAGAQFSNKNVGAIIFGLTLVTICLILAHWNKEK